MSISIMKSINEGDKVRLRDKSLVTVEFIAHMPDDLINGFEYVVRLSGLETYAFSECGKFYDNFDSGIDIMEVVV